VSPGNNDGDPFAAEGIAIDTRGLACPLPVLKVRKAMRGVAPGTKVVILATDPGAEEDIRAYCEASGCTFLSLDTPSVGVLRMVIRKS
jgi:tRNA 2-thiouridine synthesizing protein A